MGFDVLIVDDEELIRKGIRARIDYLELDVGQIYEASTGLEGLAVVKSVPIDIVLTDIRMPSMNGLAFVKETKLMKKDIHFIILSGHAEFDYAKTALQLGVKSYLLKPLSNDELKKEFEKIVEEIEEARRVKNVVTDQKRLRKEQNEYLLEKEVNALLSSNVHDIFAHNRIYKNLEIYMPGVFREKLNVALAIINIEQESYETSDFQQDNFKLLQFTLKNVFNEIEMKCEKIIINNLTNRNQLYAVFYTEREMNLRKEIEQLFLKMHSVFEDQMEVRLTFGVSKEANILSMVQTEEAKAALEQRIAYGISNIYFFEDRDVFLKDGLPSLELNRLERYMKNQNLGKIQKVLQEIFSDTMIKKYGASYCHVMWVRILNMVLMYFNPGNNPYANMEKILVSFKLLHEFDTVKEMEEELWKIIIDCIQSDKMMVTDASSKVRVAVHYIKQHFNECLSINELAERFEMSPNYFSTVFKKEMKQSTVNFINEYRIKKAMEYLKNSDQSAVEIAKRVGYDDSQYFFRVFKKIAGVPPLQYRQNSRL